MLSSLLYMKLHKFIWATQAWSYSDSVSIKEKAFDFILNGQTLEKKSNAYKLLNSLQFPRSTYFNLDSIFVGTFQLNYSNSSSSWQKKFCYLLHLLMPSITIPLPCLLNIPIFNGSRAVSGHLKLPSIHRNSTSRIFKSVVFLWK